MRGSTGVLALWLAIASPVLSQEPTGKPESTEPAWKESSGTFGAVLLVTNDPAGFFGSSSKDYLARIKTASKAQRGETVAAVVLFYGCAADRAGNCSSSVELRLRRPDGSTYGEFTGELWGGPAPPEGAWEAGADNLGFEVEPDDPLGTYTFEAVVRDRVAHRELKLSQTVEVVAR